MPTDFEIARQKFMEWWQREHSTIDITTPDGKQKHYSSEVGFLAGYMQCLDDIWAIKKAYDKCQNREHPVELHTEEFCAVCGISKCSRNFPYHVCVKKFGVTK